MLISGALFLLCAMGMLPALPAHETLMLSAGVFFICFGERTNHFERRVEYPLDEYGQYIGHKHLLVRDNKAVGIFFVIVGVVILAYAAFKLAA